MKRPEINITPIERVARMVIGGAAVVAGATLLAGPNALVAVALEVLLVLAGLDLLVTGLIGHCPLYKRLGYIPSSLRRSP